MNDTSVFRQSSHLVVALAVIIGETVTAPVAQGGDLTVREVAKAKAGQLVREISAYGPRVVWSEGVTNDFFTIEWDAVEQTTRYFADDGTTPAYSFHEWDGGIAGAIVSEEDCVLGSGWIAPAFRPLATQDGTYYLVGKARWGGCQKLFRDIAGNTVVASEEWGGTNVGEHWSYHELDSGIVIGESYFVGTRTIEDFTAGTWRRVTFFKSGTKPIGPSWGTSYATSYLGDGACFLPNAVSWQSGDVDALYVLPDGEDEPILIEGTTNATLRARGSDGSLLWTETRGDEPNFLDLWPMVPGSESLDLVLADATGTNRTTLWTQAFSWTAHEDFPAGFTSDGSVFYERLNAGKKELVLRSGTGVEEILESVSVTGAEDDSAVVFSPLPFRGGLVWMRPTGERNALGLDDYEMRARIGGVTVTVADGALLDPVAMSRTSERLADETYATDEETGEYVLSDVSYPLLPVFSGEFCTSKRIVFERLSNGDRQLCLWDGTSADDEPVVLASEYATEPFMAVNVNARGAAAAVNKGTVAAPDYRIFAAYDEDDLPQSLDLPDGTELVEYSANLAMLLKTDGADWSLCTAYCNGGALPDGCTFEVSSAGIFEGSTPAAGDYAFKVAAEKDGSTTYFVLHLSVAGNANHRPVVAMATPAPGYVNFCSGTELSFTVNASDPEGKALSYRWLVDDEEQPDNSASFTLVREVGDVSAHNVRCVIEDDLWTEANAGPAVVSREWNVGVLAIVKASATNVHVGQKATLSVVLESTVEFFGSAGKPAGFDATTWYDAANDGEVNVGNTASASADGSGTYYYYAVTKTRYGEVRTGNLAVSFDPSPAVGKIYKRTGPVIPGNRCVLHAGAWGEQPLSFSWKRDGVEVSTSQTLDIPALAASDSGTYVLTVRNEHGEVASEPFVLSPAPTGSVVGWRSSDNYLPNALPPAGLDNVVQIAALPWGGVALRANGTVAVWCDFDTGLSDVPAGLSKVASIAATHGDGWCSGMAAAVRRDGSVVTWGRNYGLISSSATDEKTGSWTMTFSPSYEYNQVAPSGLSNVVQVALGNRFGIALHADGSVSKWSYGNYFDEETGEWEYGEYCVRLKEISGGVAIFANDSEAAILLEDGSLVDDEGMLYDKVSNWPNLRAVAGELGSSWNDNWLVVDEGGAVHCTASVSWNPAQAEAVTNAIAADKQTYSNRAIVLTEDGIVNDITYDSPFIITNDAVAVSCGAVHTLALIADGGFAELPPLSYEEALDAPALTFISGGDADWVALADEEAPVGDSLARSGEIGHGQQTWIVTTLDGPGTLSFRWRVSCEDRYDSGTFAIDGDLSAKISGETEWAEVSFPIVGDGTHEVRWTYRKSRSGESGEDALWLDGVVWTPDEGEAPVVTLAEALDATDLVWTTDGDAAWTPLVGVTALVGGSCGVSGAIGDTEVSAVETTVVGPGVLSFNWAVSCEEDYDNFDFLVDGKWHDGITGESSWRQVTLAIPDGSHVLRWEYWKDEMDEQGMTGEDRALLDGVSFLPVYADTPLDDPEYARSEFQEFLRDNGLIDDGAGNEAVNAAAKTLAENGVNSVWDCFVAGLSPTNPAAAFLANIEFDADGNPIVKWDPDLNKDGTRHERDYEVEGKEKLTDGWGPTNEWSRFFRVNVTLP